MIYFPFKLYKCIIFVLFYFSVLYFDSSSFDLNSIIFQHQYHAKIDDLVDKSLNQMMSGLISKVSY